MLKSWQIIEEALHTKLNQNLLNKFTDKIDRHSFLDYRLHSSQELLYKQDPTSPFSPILKDFN
jgi:hypothetical protein